MPPVDLITSMDTPRSLRSLRAGVSVGDVARGTGLSPSHLSRVFNGRRTPSMRTALKIALFVGCTIDELYLACREAQAVIPSRHEGYDNWPTDSTTQIAA
jgi:transcriptional regulator with XRE-family HTH domain